MLDGLANSYAYFVLQRSILGILLAAILAKSPANIPPFGIGLRNSF